MAKYSKKGKSLCAVDGWLDTLGFYRKNVAYDETCLFRAVSEQLFNCQIYHERVRKECIAYARTHFQEFSHLINSEKKWNQRLSDLEHHMLFCGPIELQVISRKYNQDIIIFDGMKQQVTNITSRNYSNAILLCLMEEEHYDVIYTKEHIVNAGFCQSVIYKIFYEEVFKIPKVDEIVKNMLYEKHNLITHSDLMNNFKDKHNESNSMIAPFPFKVAKALDPNIYRNIEYDAWGDTRRELRLGEWYYGDDKLILGTRCIFNDKDTQETFECYIQEIGNQDKCVIYLTKSAQKRIVSYTDLSPEDDAKPWPLPYRFTKNLNIFDTPQTLTNDERTQKNKKRNKDKKRTKSESSIAILGSNADPVDNVTAYIGIPLQMQNQYITSTSCQNLGVSTECQTDPVASDISSSDESFILPSPQWQFVPPSPDPFVWPPPTTVPPQFGFGMKPMVASAPVTPDIVPYHDTHYPYYFNYHAEPYIYNQNWSNTPDTLPSPPKPDEKGPDLEEQAVRIKAEATSEPVQSVAPEKLKLCTGLIPQSPPVELYSPVLQIPPGTPVIYTPLPINEPDLIIQTSPVVYTPQMDMSYIPAPQFIYPPTPPATWYPPGVNAQGFIFP